MIVETWDTEFKQQLYVQILATVIAAAIIYSVAYIWRKYAKSR